MSKTIYIGVVGLVFVAAAIALDYLYGQEGDDGEVALTPVAQTEVTSEAPAKVAAVPELVAPAAVEKPILPSFDIVRINRDGDAVIAGRAAANALVSVYDGEEEIGRVTADGRGEWVLVPSQPLPPGARELSLSMQREGETPLTSESVVVLVVPGPDEEVAGTSKDKPVSPLAVLVPREGSGATKLLQGPTQGGVPDSPMDSDGVTLDLVDYDEAGNVIVGGRAPPGARVAVYAGEDPLGEAKTGDDGVWQVVPDKAVGLGLHRLRVEQIGSGGEVVAFVEMPFSRAGPLRGLSREGIVVVRPGHTLWHIARSTYGSGIRYTLVYDANRNQIHDPDLIYPGQVFSLPPTN